MEPIDFFARSNSSFEEVRRDDQGTADLNRAVDSPSLHPPAARTEVRAWTHVDGGSARSEERSARHPDLAGQARSEDRTRRCPASG